MHVPRPHDARTCAYVRVCSNDNRRNENINYCESLLKNIPSWRRPDDDATTGSSALLAPSCISPKK